MKTTKELTFPTQLKTALRQISQDRLMAHLAMDGCETRDLEQRPLVVANWLSLILLANENVRILFKTHYNNYEVARMSKALFGENPQEDALMDLMKEYCNLVGGGFKLLLSTVDISVGLSLPLLTRGFDEVFNLEEHSTESVSDSWVLSDTVNRVTCEVKIELLDSALITKLDQIQPQESSSEEIEFL